MKKTVCFILALAMCLSLCACGGGNDASVSANAEVKDASVSANEDAYAEVKQALVGEWGLCYIDDYSKVDVFEFREDGGTFFTYKLYEPKYNIIQGGVSWSITSYEITADKILYQYPDASTGEPKVRELFYTFENGTLRLYRTYYSSTVEYFKDNWLDGVIEGLRQEGVSAISEKYGEYVYYHE